ncbi:hypothetical protein FQR65_LT15396 [Abscondita terminalis]|nr:hypothetical protein FQR65_LT15396 [Abscondita terminalis]
MNKKRHRARTDYKCTSPSSQYKNVAPTFQLPLRPKVKDVVSQNKLDEDPTAGQPILRRSKRIREKNKVSLKIYKHVSDYYMQMQNDSSSLFEKINQKYVKANTNNDFCEVLKKQVPHLHTSRIKDKSLDTIKTMVANINAAIEGNKENQQSPKRHDFFKIEKKTTFLEDEPNTSEKECTPLRFNNSPDRLFNFDKHEFFATSPPLNPYPKPMYDF